ncbi:endothelin-3b [Hippocampus comes]|uniref:Endothelin-3 n=1 Tax=Hippocampus comes TaxID=109280 RepID=A0A3Q2Z754_HIPCM|nr:PREDICTED: endothelin-3-like [Hippocampus comes]XP_019743645.1 PREDICTED: endothelin-3-like [Hippocampus comes]
MQARIMLYKILALIILQGVLRCDARVISEVSPGGVSGPSTELNSGGVAARKNSDATEPKSRSKRCTCYSYKDKECIYYCHLDIIWINTPERTVPYGMSSYQGVQRMRRALVGRPSGHEQRDAQRCMCASLDQDADCHHFCQSSSVETGPKTSFHRVPRPG